jgi:membrane protein required for colicin V production
VNWLDVIIAFALGASLIKGFQKGLFREVGEIAAFLAAIWCALAFDGSVTAFLQFTFSMPLPVAYLVGFLLLLVGIYWLVSLIFGTMTRIINGLSLGWINRLSGGLFSVLKTAIVLSLLLNLYEVVDPGRRLIGNERAESAKIYVPLLKLAPTLFPSFRPPFNWKQFRERKRVGEREKLYVSWHPIQNSLLRALRPVTINTAFTQRSNPIPFQPV